MESERAISPDSFGESVHDSQIALRLMISFHGGLLVERGQFKTDRCVDSNRGKRRIGVHRLSFGVRAVQKIANARFGVNGNVEKIPLSADPLPLSRRAVKNTST